MRVLLVTHRYPPLGLSGVERLSEQTAQALHAAGHGVTVMTRRESAAPPLPSLQPTERRGIPVALVSGGGPLHGRFASHQGRLEMLFERTLVAERPDVVLVSHLIGHSPLYVPIAQRWGIPVVLELHDFFVACERAHLERVSGELCDGPEGGSACARHCFALEPDAAARWALRTHLFRRALERADETLAPSEFVAEWFERKFGLQTRPRAIGAGVDVGRPAPPQRTRASSRAPGEPLRLAIVGMVAHHKGAHVVVRALRHAHLPAVRLTLLGGVMQPYFRELLAEADGVPGLELRAYGPFEPSELPDLLADVDAVLVPSLVWESYSIVTREALSLGVPVIASRSGALPEAIRHGENGLLFEPGATEQLAALLRQLADDPDRLTALRAGIRRTDWLSVDARTRRLQEVLEAAVARGARRVDPHELDELVQLRERLSEQLHAA